MFPEQWTPGSPWADRRVRLAASLAIDRQAINEAESLGFSGPTGNIVPRHQEFALAIDPHPYDPKRAKALLAEAGYPNGFDGGELAPYPPYSGMGEAIANYLVAVGIKVRVRTMERAALLSAWRDRKIRSLFIGATGTAGNASTRIEPYATSKGTAAYGTLPEVETLFARQLQEMDRKKREELLHQIQRTPDPAHPGRSRDLRADLGERLHPRLRAARGGSGAHADPRLPLLRAARRPPAQAIRALSRFTHPAARCGETARSAAPPASARSRPACS